MIRSWLCLGLVAALVGIAACGGDSTMPPISPTPPARPSPPVVTPNAPPTIKSLTASAPRVEADETVRLTAVVEDAETPVDQLTYEWTAAPDSGAFTGSGAQIVWKAPHLQPTPDTYAITLRVTENYTSEGAMKQNVVSSSVQVHYNDSYRELNDLGVDFLVNKFGNYNVSPEACVSNFSDSCRGKADELGDIQVNRQVFQILNSTFNVDSIVLNGDRTFATVVGPCVFQDIIKATGVKEKVSGICTLTGVYENWKWFLCDSHYKGISTTPLHLLRYRVPGRLMSFE